MPRCLIIGAGVIGLSLAYELSRRGWETTLLDRGAPGRATSWAGAGILPPAGESPNATPYDQLRLRSYLLHAEWAARLREETGIDTGFRRCGGLYLARGAGEMAALAAARDDWQSEGIAVERIAREQLAALEPRLALLAPQVRSALLLPDECQLRNPRHLQALAAACSRQGVEIIAGRPVLDVVRRGEEITGLVTSRGTLTADRYCLAAGPWTPELWGRFGLPPLPLIPIRGQMLLYRTPRPLLSRVVNEGPRYVVPRDDGRLLVGSTEEEAGYDLRTTEAGLAELAAFATSLLPELAGAELEHSWAGLRPCALRGFPYIGAIPGTANGFVAAGHFRSGLYLSPGTAELLAQLISGESPSIDLRWFAMERG